MGLFLANVNWQRGATTLGLTTFGIDPAQPGFLSPDIAAKTGPLQVQMAGLLDRLSRGLPREEAAGIRPQSPLSFETSGKTLTLYDTFAGGGGFGGDGYMMVSDQTFLALFPARRSAAPDHILLRLRSGADPEKVSAELRELVSDKTLRIRSFDEAAQDDLSYQQTRRPTGIIFGFGVVIGVLVGIVIVYQVLSTDVADHMREYATFKAMGYGQGFFLGVVLEEAFILGLFGFIPGAVIATGLLTLMGKLTTLPLAMTSGMIVAVFAGTLVFSIVSGAIATRRLAGAAPADLF
jgi:putative ABC transport system permease protein